MQAASDRNQRAKRTAPCHLSISELRSLGGILQEDIRTHCDFHPSVHGPDYIDEGTFGLVYRGTIKTGPHNGKKVAVKLFKRDQPEPPPYAQMLREPYMLRLTNASVADGSGLLQLYGAYEFPPGSLSLTTTLAPGGDLFNHISQHKGRDLETCFTEAFASSVIRQIAKTVGHLHDAGILHLDLKPENLLLREECRGLQDFTAEKHLVVCDVGMAATVEEIQAMSPEMRARHKGTATYAAPEQFHHPYNWGKPSDVWSIGVISFMILTWKGYLFLTAEEEAAPPSVATTVDQAVAQQGSRVAQAWESLSSNAKDFIRACLRFSPEERPTVQQLLEHPWLVQDAPKQPLGPAIINMQAAAAENAISTAASGLLNAAGAVLAAVSKRASSGGAAEVAAEEIAAFQAALDAVAEEKKGSLQQEAFCAIAMKFLQLDRDTAERLFAVLDTDGSGEVSRDELRQGLNVLKKGDDSTLQYVFAMFDKDQSGSMDLDEMVTMFHSLGLSQRRRKADPLLRRQTTFSTSSSTQAQAQPPEAGGTASSSAGAGTGAGFMPLRRAPSGGEPSAVPTRAPSSVFDHVFQDTTLLRAGRLTFEQFKQLVMANERLSSVLLQPLKALAETKVAALAASLSALSQ